MTLFDRDLGRRDFLRYGGVAGALVGMDRLLPGWMGAGGLPARSDPGVLDGSAGPVEIVVGETEFAVGRRSGTAVTMNGTVPGPLIRFREGDEAVIHVTNTLDEDTSIHWHGIILPNAMDGVPKVNFPGIRPGETFTYRYPVGQYGTYWYHSHSRLQEQLGHYGPLVIDPAGPEPEPFDREHVVVLSDWSFESPYRILSRLKKHPDYYNFGKRTIFDFFRDVSEKGLGATVDDRLAWGRMRMMPSDISDVTAHTYAYLLNGVGPDANWTGRFEPGERVRLRFINASAATFFDVRIPGLPMTLVQTDGQHVRPVETDEFRLPIAKTYDVIVEPSEGRAYTIFAESMGRGGYARGTLAPREGMEAPVPALRERYELTMADMGMAGHGMDSMDGRHGAGHDKAGHDASAHDPADHEAGGHGDRAHAMPDHAAGGHATADHAMAGSGMATGAGLRPPGTIPEPAMHGPDDHGPGNAGIAMTAASRLDDPGNGLGDDGWRVLRYTELEALEPWPDFRPPDREIEIHLTGNMERYMWSIDGVEFSDAEPIRLEYGERVRLTMVNDTMMSHPMHLHGMWMYLENGKGARIPRVHTIEVKPAEKVSLLARGEHSTLDGEGGFELEALYSRTVRAFWNLQTGLRVDRGYGDEGATRGLVAVGLEGLAPYWFEVESFLYISHEGDLSARLEAGYELLFTQRLVLEPEVELSLAAQDVPEFGVASGLDDLELSARLRYEIVRELAPYVGVSWVRDRIPRGPGAAGNDDPLTVREASFVAGLRWWY